MGKVPVEMRLGCTAPDVAAMFVSSPHSTVNRSSNILQGSGQISIRPPPPLHRRPSLASIAVSVGPPNFGGVAAEPAASGSSSGDLLLSSVQPPAGSADAFHTEKQGTVTDGAAGTEDRGGYGGRGDGGGGERGFQEVSEHAQVRKS